MLFKVFKHIYKLSRFLSFLINDQRHGPIRRFLNDVPHLTAHKLILHSNRSKPLPSNSLMPLILSDLIGKSLEFCLKLVSGRLLVEELEPLL
jgi:hypothetical protein